MKKVLKLKICNWSLLIATFIILASGIPLEATGSRSIGFVGFHIFAGYAFGFLAIWHIALNLKWGDWFAKFRRVKSPVTRLLWWLFLLAILSGLVAFGHWIVTYEHSPIGGIHGKLGLLMILVAIGHTVKRIKYFKNSRKRR